MDKITNKIKLISCNPSNYSILILFSCLLLLVSCDSGDTLTVQKVDDTDLLNDLELQNIQNSQQTTLDSNSFSFGFNLRASPQEDTAQYLPFLTYLEKTTGYHFNLHFTPKNRTVAEELGENKIQFAALGASSFLYAKSRYSVKLIARGVNAQGKATYKSFFVVKPVSNIKDIDDIKGKRLVFGSPDSTQGHLIPLIMLSKAGIDLADLQSYGFSESHQDCAESVVSGEYDVCGMQDQLANKLADSNLVKIIHVSKEYPSSGIVVNKFVPLGVVQRVTQAMLDFKPLSKHREGLYNWDQTEMAHGFIRGNKNDYDELLKWLTKLGYLEKNETRD